jgi:putative transposase
MDEACLKVNGQWKYYYRAVDKQGNTIDFLLTAKRDKKAALRFLRKALNENGKPSLVNIDQSGSNQAGLKQLNRDNKPRIKIRQCKYLNNIIEQDHRRIKRLTRPMMEFKNFHAAECTLAGIEVMAMLKKGQMNTPAGDEKSPAEMFYALAA